MIIASVVDLVGTRMLIGLADEIFFIMLQNYSVSLYVVGNRDIPQH